MPQPLPHDHPLRRLFSGTVQHVFYVDMGMCDPQVAEYLTGVLSSFIHMDELYPFRDALGKRIEDLAQIATDAEMDSTLSEDERQRRIHRHIGDLALFWSGVFPEGVGRLKSRQGLGLNELVAQGKRSYGVTYELTPAEDDPPPRVFQRLSDHFEYCVYGLNLCRKEWDGFGEKLFPQA